MKVEDCEATVIAGLIERPDLFRTVEGRLFAQDFQEQIFSKTFGAISSLLGAGKIPQDPVVLAAALRDRLTPDEMNILTSVVNDSLGANKSLPFFARQVRKESIRREIEREIKNGADSARLLALTADLCVVDQDSVLYRPVSQINSVQDGGPLFLTGFADLDRVVRFRPGQVITLAGRTGEGKTSLAVQMLYNLSGRIPAGIISLEMTAEELRDRVENSFGKRPNTLFIADPPACSSSDFWAICRALREEQGVQVILADYLQLFREKSDFKNRHLEVSHIIRRIKETAKELKLGVIVVSQISRNIDTRGPKALPCLADLKESGDIEYAADTVLFLHQPPEDDTEHWCGDNVKWVLVAKNRGGKLGKLKLYWESEKTRFSNFYEGDDV